MSKKIQSYSEEFKLSVIRDYYSSGMSKYACAKKYGLKSQSTFPSWLQKYGSQENPVPFPPEQLEEEMAKCSKEDYKEENAQLKKRIRELEKALEFSRLETMARDMMIDKAEEYLTSPSEKNPSCTVEILRPVQV